MRSSSRQTIVGTASCDPVVTLLVRAAVVTVLIVMISGCSRGQEVGRPTTTATAGTIPGTPATTTAPAKSAVSPTAKTETASLTTPDGRERTYRTYVPTSLPAGQPVPLLIAMHGGTGWAEQFERNSGFDGLAEANQFIVVYPDGVNIGPAFPMGRVWNGGNCCGPAVRDNVDDVAFISQLIDTLEAKHTIDAKRVYAAGHSNGGIMSYRLACELSDKIVAIGLQAGWLAIPAETCRPQQPVSVIHIHGTGDKNAPIDGGRGERSIAGVDATAAIDNVRKLASADRCSAQPTETTSGDLTTIVWSPCAESTAVELVKVKDASHAWMGHQGNPIQERIVGGAYDHLDSSAEIWSFLAAHPRP